MGTALTTMHSNGAMALTTPDMEERRDLLQNLIMRNGSKAQVDLVMHLCNHYGLDPLLKHLVLINGAAYITRDGLLHIAHASGRFDGIEVELSQGGKGEWAATCTVYRKDMNRPIRYTAYQNEHAQKGGAWDKYPRAMLQKCAEVMCLRRAFDVSLGAVEELGYDGQQPQSSIGQVVTIERPQLAATIEHDPDDDLSEYVPANRPAPLAPPARTTPPAAQPVAAESQYNRPPNDWTAVWTEAKAQGIQGRTNLAAFLGVAESELPAPAAILEKLRAVAAQRPASIAG